MPITKDSLITIPITPEMISFVEYLANKRKLFEYPRAGYGDYNKRGNSNIKNGMLGELGFFEYIHSNLDEKYGHLPAEERWKWVKDRFTYNPVIGKFDGGYDFLITGKTVDIKTYVNKVVTAEEILHLNLLVDKDQNSKADYYVQAFIMPEKKICLAGYCEGLPPPATFALPKDAYAKPVKDLLNMGDLLYMALRNK